MNPRVAITLSESALADLQALRRWYDDQELSDLGIRLVTEILSRIDSLADHPDLGRVVPEFDQRFLRELIHPPFRIVYRRGSNVVQIVRVWRSERLLQLPEDE